MNVSIYKLNTLINKGLRNHFKQGVDGQLYIELLATKFNKRFGSRLNVTVMHLNKIIEIHLKNSNF